jgi:hypothetical protein
MPVVIEEPVDTSPILILLSAKLIPVVPEIEIRVVGFVVPIPTF